MTINLNIVTVIASPRKNGNCKKIADIITSQIKGNNSVYFVDELNISACKGCRACKNMEKPTKCILNDDFNVIMDKVSKSDVFIFAAPNYFGEINAQGHIFMDRFYSMTKTTPNRLKNSPKTIVIHTYGAKMGHYDEYINKRSNLFKSIGCDVVEVVSIGENMPTKKEDEKLIEYLKNIGKNISNNQNTITNEILSIIRNGERIIKAEVMTDEMKSEVTKKEINRLEEMIPVINKGLEEAFNEEHAIVIVKDKTGIIIPDEELIPTLTLRSENGNIIGEEVYDPDELEELKNDPNIYFISEHFATYPNLSVPGEKQFFVVSDIQGEFEFEEDIKKLVKTMIIADPSTEADHYIKDVFNIDHESRITTKIIGYTV